MLLFIRRTTRAPGLYACVIIFQHKYSATCLRSCHRKSWLVRECLTTLNLYTDLFGAKDVFIDTQQAECVAFLIGVENTKYKIGQNAGKLNENTLVHPAIVETSFSPSYDNPLEKDGLKMINCIGVQHKMNKVAMATKSRIAF